MKRDRLERLIFELDPKSGPVSGSIIRIRSRSSTSRNLVSDPSLGLALNYLQSFPRGRGVKSMDFRSDGDCRSIPYTDDFFLNDDGLMMMASERKARALMRVQSTKHEGVK